MASYLTIPDLVESEPMLSLVAGSDGVTFSVVIALGDTAVRLVHSQGVGEHLPLVVLTTDTQILALDSVYVTEISLAAEHSEAYVTFSAQAVRFV
jgi:hypothetical protein